jgi:hypothetical protein
MKSKNKNSFWYRSFLIKHKLILLCLVFVLVTGFLAIHGPPVLATSSSTGLYVDPATKSVANAASFTVNVDINTSLSTVTGWQGNISFDPAKLQADSVSTTCPFLAGHGGSVLSGGAPIIDNTNGQIIAINYAAIGQTSAATGTGILSTITFHAIAQNTTVNINFVPTVNLTISGSTSESDTLVDDANGAAIANLGLTGSTITIGTPATTSTTTTTTTSTTTATTQTSSTTTTTPTTSTSKTTTTTTTTTPTTSTATTAAVTGSGSTTTLSQITIPSIVSTSSLLITTGSTTPTTSTTSNQNQPPTKLTAIKNSNILDISQYFTPDGSGIIAQTYSIAGKVSLADNVSITGLQIDANCRALSSDGTPVTNILINPASITSLPSGFTVISGVEFDPSGATFSPPITVTFSYNSSSLPKGVKDSSLILKYYNVNSGQWEPCDFSVNAQDHTVVASISHFSTYAIMYPNSKAVSLSLVAIIMFLAILAVGVAMYSLLYRRQGPIPAAQTATVSNSSGNRSDNFPVTSRNEAMNNTKNWNDPDSIRSDKNGDVRIAWDDILPNRARDGVFKTTLEIQGGKIIVPRDEKSADIELINSVNNRVMVTLEYDPILHPQGSVKIIILGPVSELEKMKEIKK